MLLVENLSLGSAGNGLADISFRLEDEILAVIGPNDSGKSLLLEAITGRRPIETGLVKIGHFNLLSEPERAKAQFGYLPSETMIEMYLTGWEWLDLVGSIYHLSPKIRRSRIQVLAERLECLSWLSAPLERLSLPFQRKIQIIASLIHQSRLVLWDDPTAGLDYGAQTQLSLLVREANQSGAAIIIATNHLEWVEELVERYLVLESGRIIYDGGLKALGRRWGVTGSLGAIYSKVFGEVTDARLSPLARYD